MSDYKKETLKQNRGSPSLVRAKFLEKHHTRDDVWKSSCLRAMNTSPTTDDWLSSEDSTSLTIPADVMGDSDISSEPLDDVLNVPCPVCLRGLLRACPTGCECTFCQLSLKVYNPLLVRDSVIKAMREHSLTCPAQPAVLVDELNDLVLVCTACGLFKKLSI